MRALPSPADEVSFGQEPFESPEKHGNHWSARGTRKRAGCQECRCCARPVLDAAEVTGSMQHMSGSTPTGRAYDGLTQLLPLDDSLHTNSKSRTSGNETVGEGGQRRNSAGAPLPSAARQDTGRAGLEL